VVQYRFNWRCFRALPASAGGTSTSNLCPCAIQAIEVIDFLGHLLRASRQNHLNRTISAIQIADYDRFRMYYGNELTGVAVLRWSADRTGTLDFVPSWAGQLNSVVF
jgi:hypothetical protein